jgi:hypothetical protein
VTPEAFRSPRTHRFDVSRFVPAKDTRGGSGSWWVFVDLVGSTPDRANAILIGDESR